ncbi:YkvA family protein [Lonsdalea quercina]|uniref:YkvA family protein n=1 Tax=Lonsdalea quercina TaxID=71657 RepID=UPI003976A3C5
MVNKFTQADDFNETRFWTKIVGYAKKAGREVIEKALWLYYAAQRPDTPVWAKTTIYAALAYFVLPVDAIPDALPVVGFTDDLGVLAGAMGTVSLYINEEVKRQTHDKLADGFNSSTTLTSSNLRVAGIRAGEKKRDKRCRRLAPALVNINVAGRC